MGQAGIIRANFLNKIRVRPAELLFFRFVRFTAHSFVCYAARG